MISVKLVAKGEAAVKVLSDIMDDKEVPPGVRVQAASKLLDLVFKDESDELEERLERLEALSSSTDAS
jgi:uncharacterized protein (UPF0147 family)